MRSLLFRCKSTIYARNMKIWPYAIPFAICIFNIFFVLFNTMYEIRRQQHPLDYIFLYNAFLSKEERSAQTSMIMLLAADKDQQKWENLVCLLIQGNSRRRMEMTVERVPGLGLCRMEVFVAKCMLPSVFEMKNYGNVEQEAKLAISFIKRRNSKDYIKINPHLPDTKKRELVICMSRVIAFERWQLIIAALELYKEQKPPDIPGGAFQKVSVLRTQVNLVVTHVQSVLKSVYELMRVYEEDGILKIRAGIRFPFLEGMPYDPNSQTEFNGQIILAHECFYEFRESAKFIALIDWDDLLVAAHPFRSLAEPFSRALAEKPRAGYLLINKLESTFNVQDDIPQNFDLKHLLTRGILTANMQNNEKMVVVPRKIHSFWMHYPRHMADGLNWLRDVKRVISNYSVMLHAANEERVYPHEFNLQITGKMNMERINRHFRKSIWKSSKLSISKLPRERPYFNALNHCHAEIFNYLKFLGLHNIKICLTYSLCKLPQLDVECMVTENRFRRHLVSQKLGMAVFVRNSARFVQENGCTQFGRVF